MGGCEGKNLGCFGEILDSNLKVKNLDDHREVDNVNVKVKVKVCDDDVGLLPSDPFDMNKSVNFENGFGIDETEVKREDADGLFSMKIEEKPVALRMDKSYMDTLYDDSLLLCGNVEDLYYFGYDKYCVLGNATHKCQNCVKDCCDCNRGYPHDAFVFALGYLGLRDLLCVERVCKSLRDAVQNDPLLWRRVHIGQPLNRNVTNDALLRLTSRAQGSLQCLSLMECLKISDSGLESVLESNPGLTKLSVAGCVGLTVEGILTNLKVFNSSPKSGIKHLRIGNIFGATKEHLEEFKILLDANNCKKKPRLYRGRHSYLSIDDDCAIDVDICPKCQEVRQLYDCPLESRKTKHHNTQLWNACFLCIPRCFSCGRCFRGYAYGGIVGRDGVCFDCFEQLLHCHSAVALYLQSARRN